MSQNPSNLTAFRDAFKGIRANRYTLECPFRDGPKSWEEKIYVRALSLPGTNIGMIPVAYQGRVVKFSGERQFGEWTVQVYDSSSRNLRQLLEDWVQKMDNASSHEYHYNFASDWTVNYGDDLGGVNPGHVGFDGPANTRQMKLYSCWPIDISPIDLSHDSYDTFAEFSLTVAYDYHEFIGGFGSGAGGGAGGSVGS